MKQAFTSASTSINKTRLPSVYNKVLFKENDAVLDYGCGKYIEHIRKHVQGQGAIYLPYDKYNQTEEVNFLSRLYFTLYGGFDVVICSNVLNVILEEDVRKEIVCEIYDSLKYNGVAYFSIYEGKGNFVPTSDYRRDSCQLNYKSVAYMPMIINIFGCDNVSRHGNIIVAVKHN